MDSFSPNIAPESLEGILSSLQALLDHNQKHPQHTLFNTNAPHYPVHEPFSNQLAEQYDDPMILEEIAPCPVHAVVTTPIPVLKNVVHRSAKIEKLITPPAVDVEKILNELRAELSDIVADIMIDAREHLQAHDADSQEIMQTSLKRFLHDLTSRLPR